MMITFSALIVSLCFSTYHFSDSIPQPKSYDIYRTRKAPKIDGRIGRAEWASSDWTESFVDITGDPGLVPRHETKCRMLWDDSCLYIAAMLTEPHLWGTLTNHDAIIFRDNDFEVFIDPNDDTEQYFEIEINALNAVMDLFMSKPYRKGGSYDMGWDALTRSAVRLRGSLNDPGDLDKGWTMEMAIPFEALRRPGRTHLPNFEKPWRINFSRVQWALEYPDQVYTKKKGTNGKPLPEDNWVWSPIGVVNMHIPENWGFLYFKGFK